MIRVRLVSSSREVGLGPWRPENPGHRGWPHLLARQRDDFVVMRGSVVTIVDSNGESRWSTPLTLDGRAQAAHLSADRLLLTTVSSEYHSRWGILGPALLLDRNDGTLMAELRGTRGAALSEGRFLLGLEGYDIFETLLHGRDGSVLQRWPSYGHYIVDPGDEIRVIEEDRTMPTESRIVRLRASGEILHGSELLDGLSSEPVVLADGDALFVNGGWLWGLGRDLRDRTLIQLVQSCEHPEMWRLTLDRRLLIIELWRTATDLRADHVTQRWVVEVQPGHV